MNENGKIKALWASNSPTSKSGYGGQTDLFSKRIKAAGYGIAIAANYGCEGAPFMTTDSILVLPRVVDSAGNDIILGHFQYTQSDLVISLYDPHAYNADVWRQFPWCSWVPVDSTPLFDGNKNALQAARWIWSMSRHGDATLRAAGFSNVTYVPHGIDTKNAYLPINRDEARGRLGSSLNADFRGKYMIAVNSANKGTPSRKGFYEMFMAFKAFSDRHPDAVLFVHTEAMGAYAGENMPRIIELVGINPDRVFFSPQYQLVTGMLGNEYLRDIYNSADLFLSTSHGEGFGIPIVEAQACGTPVLVTHCSAMTELCMSGVTIKSTTYMPVVGTTWERPIVADAVEKMEAMYTRRNETELRTQAREGALAYDADTVFATYMLPAIEKMQAELYTVPVPTRVLHKRRKAETVVQAEHSNGKVQEAELIHVA